MTDMKRYTFIKPASADDMPERHEVYLSVGNQSFCVTPVGCQDRKHAEWFQDRLAGALETIVRESRDE